MAFNASYVIAPEDVADAETFVLYCQQRLGTPFPNLTVLMTFRRNVKAFFGSNPQATWQTLVRTADWCSNNRKRFQQPSGVIALVPSAWSAGYLPELDPVQRVDVSLEEKIDRALKQETDMEWRRRLMISSGSMRKVVYDAWLQSTSFGSGVFSNG